tara:strand:+ start:346 stop:1062 length:717 start_codon:yes stop_codon:yes gene_type:complete
MNTEKDGYPETIHQSLVALRGVLTNPPQNSINPAFGSKYAKLEDIIHHIRGPLSEHGLTFVQHIITEERTIKAQTILIHASGETMTLDGPAVLIEKFTAHGTGSAATYAKRYSLCTALGIESDADDDGNAVEETFEGKDTKKPPPKEAKREPKKAAKPAPEPASNADDTLNILITTFNKFAEDPDTGTKTVANLEDLYRQNVGAITQLQESSPEDYKQLMAHLSAMKAELQSKEEPNA